jgi:hypothetical protein
MLQNSGSVRRAEAELDYSTTNLWKLASMLRCLTSTARSSTVAVSPLFWSWASFSNSA